MNELNKHAIDNKIKPLKSLALTTTDGITTTHDTPIIPVGKGYLSPKDTHYKSKSNLKKFVNFTQTTELALELDVIHRGGEMLISEYQGEQVKSYVTGTYEIKFYKAMMEGLKKKKTFD